MFSENYPAGLIWGEGTTVLGTDQKRYTDWIAGLLALLLGYNHPAVNRAVRRVISDGGPTWSLRHPLEEKVAKLLCKLAGYDQARFVKTGSEACSAAVRIARAVTGRNIVVSSGYHGWHDSLLTTPPAWGRPTLDDIIPVQYGSFPSDKGRLRDVAAVIIEPVTLEPVDRKWLVFLREWCTEHGALLIFDECITGGRYPGFTAARHYEVSPDLLVLSKCLANGWPLGAVLGNADVMRCFDLDWKPAWSPDGQSGPVYVSGTYSTEIASLAAAEATLTLWSAEHLGHQLWGNGFLLERLLRKEMATSSVTDIKHIKLKGPPYRLALESDLETKTKIMASMAKQGHLIGTGWNLMAAHTEADIRRTVEAFRNSLLWLGEPAGRCIVAPYRQS